MQNKPKAPKRFVFLITQLVNRYFSHDVGRDSAALTYYLLFAIFPLLIFVSTLLGVLRLDIESTSAFLLGFIPADVVDVVRSYLVYVSENASRQLMWFSLVFSLLVPLYMLAQGERRPLREIVPGVAASLAVWMLLSFAFSYYVEHLARYTQLYGAIAAIVVVLLWLYMSGTIMIMGAEFNGAILKWKNRDVPAGDGEEQT